MWVLAILLLLAGTAFSVLNAQSPWSLAADWSLASLAIGASFATVGALVAARRGNTVGWLFAALGVGVGVVNFSRQYATYALFTAPEALPAGPWAAWVMAWGVEFNMANIALSLLLFPNGRVPTRRWRPAAVLVAVVAVCGVTLSMLAPLAANPMSPFTSVVNPIAVLRADTATRLFGGYGMAQVGVLLLSAASLVVRLVRSRGHERLQVKWVAFSAAVAIGSFAATGVALSLSGLDDSATGVMALVTFPAIPIAAGVAIMRYRLYEIDRIVSRTLAYGLLTAVLVGLYAGGVVAGQALLAPLTTDAQWAVAAATMAVAAAFGPLRRRLQDSVDRRFNRARFDAARTVEAFSGRLRDEVDLGALSGHLQAVAARTVQPTHVSLWLRTGDARATGVGQDVNPTAATTVTQREVARSRKRRAARGAQGRASR